MKKVSFISLFLLLALLLFTSLVVSQQSGKPNLKIINDYSLNWAGYYVYNDSFSFASSTWVVPSVSNTTSGYSSAWVGIGGVNGNGLVQTGTAQDCTAITTSAGNKIHGRLLKIGEAEEDIVNPSSNGGGRGGSGKTTSCTPNYYAWWETYPDNAEQKISSITISPGDLIYSYVNETGPGVWVIHLEDQTNNQSFTKIVNFSADKTTAETIIERPALCFVNCKLTNLANFGTINFNEAYAKGINPGYYDLLTNTATTMISNSFRILANPSSISNPGQFNVSWYKSS